MSFDCRVEVLVNLPGNSWLSVEDYVARRHAGQVLELASLWTGEGPQVVTWHVPHRVRRRWSVDSIVEVSRPGFCQYLTSEHRLLLADDEAVPELESSAEGLLACFKSSQLDSLVYFSYAGQLQHEEIYHSFVGYWIGLEGANVPRPCLPDGFLRLCLVDTRGCDVWTRRHAGPVYDIAMQSVSDALVIRCGGMVSAAAASEFLE